MSSTYALPPLDWSKPFSWSYSKLKNFETCPRRHLEIDLSKRVKEDDTEALKEGNAVHDLLAKAIGTDDNDKREPRDRIVTRPLPEARQDLQGWVDYATQYRARGYAVNTELALAIDKNFQPVPWFDGRDNPGRAWYRAKVDVAAIHKGGLAHAIDWKTGKVKEDQPQLALNALVIFSHYPHVKRVTTEFAWIGYDDNTPETFEREKRSEIWAGIYPRVLRLARAYETRSYPENPSGLCKRWCPVVACQHNGRRT